MQASEYESEKVIILTTTNGGKFDATLSLKIKDTECQMTVINVEKSKGCCYQGIIDTIRKDSEQKHDLKCRGKAINFCERHITHKNTEAPAFKRS